MEYTGNFTPSTILQKTC